LVKADPGPTERKKKQQTGKRNKKRNKNPRGGVAVERMVAGTRGARRETVWGKKKREQRVIHGSGAAKRGMILFKLYQ